jgi:hypothetical protein
MSRKLSKERQNLVTATAFAGTPTIWRLKIKQFKGIRDDQLHTRMLRHNHFTSESLPTAATHQARRLLF